MRIRKVAANWLTTRRARRQRIDRSVRLARPEWTAHRRKWRRPGDAADAASIRKSTPLIRYRTPRQNEPTRVVTTNGSSIETCRPWDSGERTKTRPSALKSLAESGKSNWWKAALRKSITEPSACGLEWKRGIVRRMASVFGTETQRYFQWQLAKS